jgi:hypothetical protein
MGSRLRDLSPHYKAQGTVTKAVGRGLIDLISAISDGLVQPDQNTMQQSGQMGHNHDSDRGGIRPGTGRDRLESPSRGLLARVLAELDAGPGDDGDEYESECGSGPVPHQGLLSRLLDGPESGPVSGSGRGHGTGSGRGNGGRGPVMLDRRRVRYVYRGDEHIVSRGRGHVGGRRVRVLRAGGTGVGDRHRVECRCLCGCRTDYEVAVSDLV